MDILSVLVVMLLVVRARATHTGVRPELQSGAGANTLLAQPLNSTSAQKIQDLRRSEGYSQEDPHESGAEGVGHLYAHLQRIETMLAVLQQDYRRLEEELANVKESQRWAPHGQVQCRSEFTWWHDTVGKSLDYLDNFDIHCRHGEFLRQWRMTWGEMNGKKAIRYVCCGFVTEPD